MAEDGATKSSACRKIGGILDINPVTLHDWIRKAEAINAQAMAESGQEKDAEVVQGQVLGSGVSDFRVCG